MQRFTYQNFDVIFSHTAAGEYSASVFGGGGDGDVTFTLADIQAALAGNLPAATNDATDEASRHIVVLTNDKKDEYLFRPPPTDTEAKELGKALFKNVFKDSLRISFETKRKLLPDPRTCLRVRLNLTKVPELASLPWEYLCNDIDFLAMARRTTIIRYLNDESPPTNPLVEGPVKILAVISAPSDAPELDGKKELENLQNALKPLENKGWMTLEVLPKPTLDELQKKLQTGDYHIFHFIGHGAFDRQKGEGSLIFENENGEALSVSSDDLALNLDQGGFKLAVINACEGAVSAKNNAYTGVAQKLLQKSSIPAVLAMQYKINDKAAITFATKFYEALTNDYPIEAALTQARIGIKNDGNEVEWATPVLYMRSDDGRIKKESDEGAISILADSTLPVPEEHPELSPEMIEHYDAVFEALRDGQLVPFVGLDANAFGRTSNPDKWEHANGLPDSIELARYLSHKVEYPLNDLPDLARIAQYSFATKQLGKVYDEITKIFTNDINQPTVLHITIAELAAIISDEAKKGKDSTYLRTTDAALRRFIVVSTGYDSLFETAFKQIVKNFHVISYVARGDEKGKFQHILYSDSNPGSRPEFISSPNDYTGLADGNPVILKLPGMIQNMNLAITEDDYFDYLSKKELTTWLPAVITDKLQRSNLLFLGYSPCSWIMRGLLYRIWGRNQSDIRQSWAVLSQSPSLEEKFWEVCQVTIINSELRSYIEGLRARAQTT